MKKIAILSQKGGTGKTYFATNLSVAAQRHGQTTVLVDLDPQSSSAKWGDTRAEDTPVVISTHSERLPKMLQLAAENGASVAIIDTAPHTQAAALDAARAADLVIIPCKPDLVSIQAIGTTINLVHLAKVPARIVLNGVTHYGTLAKQAREGLSIYDIPCAPCQIGDRIAFVHAYNAGYGVIEFQPRSKPVMKSQHFTNTSSQHWRLNVPDKEKVNLAEVLKQNNPAHQEQHTPKEGLVEPQQVNEKIAASRRGKKNISGYFAPEVHRQLRILAAEEDKNLQEILGDALNAFFLQKGKPPIA